MRKISWVVLLAGLATALAGCSTDAPAVLRPAGPAAREISQLGWIFTILGTLVFLATMGYLAYGLARPRPRTEDRQSGTQIVIVAGMIIPAVILLVLFVLNTNALGQVSAPPADEAEVVIEVSGRQWWWEVRYPDQQITTANEIHIPVGQPVLLKLASEDVIHSFWVPELHGKMDLIPGRVNDFWIQADQPGVYQGACAEYCGTQHAKMLIRVVAEPQADYEAWVAQMQQPALLPQNAGSAQRGLEVFLEANCMQCHAIQGTNASGELGPDLTHLASRQTVGAGILPLNRSNLGGWISNPHGAKPGVKMPPSDISSEDLQALLDFLLTLK
jgi:cytochrome c oxidase subunit II